MTATDDPKAARPLPPNRPRPRKFSPQFTLGTLLFGMLIAAIFFGYSGLWSQRVMAERSRSSAMLQSLRAELQAEQQAERLDYDVLRLVACPQPRAVLHQRIEQRFDAMMAEGFLEEARGLYERGDLHRDLPSMRCVGYRQMLQYLGGHYNFERMSTSAVAATRQLAKRQYTWLRAEADCTWLWDGDHPIPDALRLATRFIGA